MGFSAYLIGFCPSSGDAYLFLPGVLFARARQSITRVSNREQRSFPQFNHFDRLTEEASEVLLAKGRCLHCAARVGQLYRCCPQISSGDKH